MGSERAAVRWPGRPTDHPRHHTVAGATGLPPRGPDAQPVRGALVHGLRHTYATELANSEVSVYTLMKLLGHESMATSQRYVAGTETRTAAAQNTLYGLLEQEG
jgi:integrase